MRTIGLLWLVACNDKGSDDLPPDNTGTEPEVDLVREAYGGCTSTSEEVDERLGVIATQSHTYDENGDVQHASADYLDDETFYDWEITYTFGAVHEVWDVLTSYTRTDATGWSDHNVWEEGQVIREERDYGPDGTVDEVGTHVFDGDQRVHWEWDLDGDGDIDDSADFTWTAEGDGWRVVAEGTDPNGEYRTEELRDSELHQLSYHYEDATGITVDWEVDEYSILGFVAGFVSETRQDGELVETESDRSSFDELGREIEVVHEREAFSGGDSVGSLSRTTTTVFDCP